ncbi:sperm-associated antigen 8 [Tamandua tetradactyla]|uniref:sperm-associated antigen 8 n=1 Tax=Tamandua tetradactyla TaxID=48850 RepID=UPI0040540AC5
METNPSSEETESRSLDVQHSSGGLGSTSEPFPSSDGGARSALTAATVAAAAAASVASAAAAASTAKAAALSAKTPGPYSQHSLLTQLSSDLSLPGEPSTESSFTQRIGCESQGFEPVYVSCITQDPCTTTDLTSSSIPIPGSSSVPVPGSSSGPVPGSSSSPVPDFSSGPVPGSSSGPVPASSSSPGRSSGPGYGLGPDSGPNPVPDSGPCPGSGPELSSYTVPRNRRLGADLVPDYATRSYHGNWGPQKPPSWKFLQVPEPGARGLWKPPEVERKSKVLHEALPRGQCLLYNWEEERATNHLDRVPSMQDGSESFFFRHGHRGLLTLQPQSPMPSSTTQKDSYQSPGNLYQPLRGKREARLEMLLHHQICEEVQAEQEPKKKLFEVESVTHHDYRMELVQAGPPAPIKPHDYHWEQPETFWIQRAPQLPGVSNIKTLDTPFRRNCSFTTPVPLSLGQPLPYEPENPHQL